MLGKPCRTCQQGQKHGPLAESNDVLDVSEWTKVPFRRFSALSFGTHVARSMSIPPEGRRLGGCLLRHTQGCVHASKHLMSCAGCMWPNGHVNDGGLEVVGISDVSWIRYVGLMTRIAFDGGCGRGVEQR